MKREIRFLDTSERVSLAEQLALLCKALDASIEVPVAVTEAA